MQQKHYSRTILSAIAAATLAFSTTAVLAEDMTPSLPQQQQAGDITYRSGGVGIDESRAMKAQASKYPLSMTFTSHMGKRNVYTAPTKVTIEKTDGTQVLDIAPNGPMLLVDLPAGNYKVSADYADQNKTQSVNVVDGRHRALTFGWSETEQQTQPPTTTEQNATGDQNTSTNPMNSTTTDQQNQQNMSDPQNNSQ